MLRPEDVLPYLQRDWDRVRRSDLAAWAALSPGERLELGDQLRQHVAGLGRSEDRDADLAHHIVWVRRIRAIR